MKLKIVISEPWDFESSDGKNILNIIIVDKKDNNIIAKALSNYKDKNDDILIISKRNESGDINIFQKNEVGNLQLKMIGTYAHEYKRKSKG